MHAREKSSEKSFYETRLIGLKRSDKYNGDHAMQWALALLNNDNGIIFSITMHERFCTCRHCCWFLQWQTSLGAAKCSSRYLAQAFILCEGVDIVIGKLINLKLALIHRAQQVLKFPCRALSNSSQQMGAHPPHTMCGTHQTFHVDRSRGEIFDFVSRAC